MNEFSLFDCLLAAIANIILFELATPKRMLNFSFNGNIRRGVDYIVIKMFISPTQVERGNNSILHLDLMAIHAMICRIHSFSAN